MEVRKETSEGQSVVSVTQDCSTLGVMLTRPPIEVGTRGAGVTSASSSLEDTGLDLWLG